MWEAAAVSLTYTAILLAHGVSTAHSTTQLDICILLKLDGHWMDIVSMVAISQFKIMATLLRLMIVGVIITDPPMDITITHRC